MGALSNSENVMITNRFQFGEGKIFCMKLLKSMQHYKKEKNQSPKGIMRSAVPLPCFFDVVKSEEGSRAAAPTGDKVL